MYDEFDSEDFESFDSGEGQFDDVSVEELSGIMDETIEDYPDEMVEGTENSALDNMTEYMAEYNYGKEDYETYSQDPEWQQLNNDLLAEMDREPVDYEDSTVETVENDVTDVPHIMENPSVEDFMDSVEISDPDQLDQEMEESQYQIEHDTDYYNSLLESRPDLAEMFESGEFYEQGNNEFGFEGTCGETTQANTFNHLLGTNEFTENDVLSIAIDKDLCEVDMENPANSGGTSTEQFMELYNEMNHRTGDQLDVNVFDYENALGIEEMASRLEDGSVLNIAVDSNVLWDQPGNLLDDMHYTDHWISVTGVERDSFGSVAGFKIVDSGGGESYLNVDKFERCYYGEKDSPVMDPTCIVVSKKGK